MRVLKKKVQKAGIIKNYRDKTILSKPSEIKREKERKANLLRKHKEKMTRC